MCKVPRFYGASPIPKGPWKKNVVEWRMMLQLFAIIGLGGNQTQVSSYPTHHTTIKPPHYHFYHVTYFTNYNFQIQKTKKKSKAIVYQKRKNSLILTFNFGCKFDCFVFISIKINFEPNISKFWRKFIV